MISSRALLLRSSVGDLVASSGEVTDSNQLHTLCRNLPYAKNVKGLVCPFMSSVKHSFSVGIGQYDSFQG